MPSINTVVEEIEKEFDETFCYFIEKGMFMGQTHLRPDMTSPDNIKSFLSSSIKKTLESVRGEVEELLKNNLTKTDDYNLGKDEGYRKVSTLLTSVIEKIK